jgi:hypothetical protein
MYSVEYIPVNDPHNCWNQWYLGRYKLIAKFSLFNLRMTLGKNKTNWNFRIREV